MWVSNQYSYFYNVIVCSMYVYMLSDFVESNDIYVIVNNTWVKSQFYEKIDVTLMIIYVWQLVFSIYNEDNFSMIIKFF